jgi:hypothetical protein
MAFLCENVMLIAPGGSLELDSEQWCGLLNLGLMPEPDQDGRPLPGEAWKHDWVAAAMDDEKLPVFFSPEQATAFADGLERYSAGIPEKEDFGKLLSVVDRPIDGQWRKYAVTTQQGWIETDDVEIGFIEDGKSVIHEAIAIFRSGRVRVVLCP